MGFLLNSIIVLVVACWILMLAGQYIVSCMLNLLQFMVELISDILKLLTAIGFSSQMF